MAMAAAVLVVDGSSARAAIVPTVPLGASTGYVVVGASTVTNTGASTLYGSLGLSPGTAITGFPPGLVIAPGQTHTADGPAGQAQGAVTTAYLDAKGRDFDATTTAQLAGKTLRAGVWTGPSKSPLWLGGTLTLDGENDPNSVFIFQTDSTLITASASTVRLVNGARECNVFWQVGSSATLGTDSEFTGTILALTSITVTTNVTVHGRALATTGAVTLDDDTFVLPSCEASDTGPTTTAPGGSSVTTTPTGGGGGSSVTTTPTGGTSATTTPTGGATVTTSPTGGPVTTIPTGGTGTATPRPARPGVETTGGPGVPGVVGPPRTGATPTPAGGGPAWPAVLLGGLLGAAATPAFVGRHRTDAPGTPRAEG